MKWIFVLVAATALLFSSCKCCKERKSNQTDVVVVAVGSTTGTVSHQFRETGCKTVILIDGSQDNVIIPVEGLPVSLDVDGKIILFDYSTLKMPQPEGCSKGIPAQLTNVSEKK